MSDQQAPILVTEPPEPAVEVYDCTTSEEANTIISSVPVNSIANTTADICDSDLYRTHVIHYFDTHMNNDIMALPQEQKEKMFQMFHDYADVLNAIFHKGIPILEFIVYGDQWYSAKADPHDGINWDFDCEIVKQYKEWLLKK